MKVLGLVDARLMIQLLKSVQMIGSCFTSNFICTEYLVTDPLSSSHTHAHLLTHSLFHSLIEKGLLFQIHML